MLPLVWRRLLRAARVLLGLGCVSAQLIATGPTVTSMALLFGVYAIYSIIAVAWRNLEESGHALLALVVDSLVLYLTLSCNTPYFSWIAVLFYAFVLSEAVLEHDWWRPVAIASLAVLVINFTHPIAYPMLLAVLVTTGILAAVVAAERQLLKDRLANAARQSVMYRCDAEKAREEERQRIAADFHDGPLQSFVGFQMRLEVIRKLMSRSQYSASADEVVQLQDLCKTQVQELRAFARSMRPMDMDGSLNASIRRVVEQFQKDSGMQASFVSEEFVDPAEPEISLELLQIVREALYNVQKHSGASRVAIGINRTDGAIEISIEDNGSGFPFSGKYTLEELELLRLGPGSIKRRVRSLGGDLWLDSVPGQGVNLRIVLAV